MSADTAGGFDDEADLAMLIVRRPAELASAHSCCLKMCSGFPGDVPNCFYARGNDEQDRSMRNGNLTGPRGA